MSYNIDINLHRRLLTLLYKNEEEHVGSCFSCIDYLDEIWKNKNKDDIFILSNGHAAYALYVLLEKYEGVDAQKLVDKHLGHPNLDYENNSIKVFFNKNDFNLIGWETIDIYQNVVQTFISDIQKNNSVNEKIFNIQRYIN